MRRILPLIFWQFGLLAGGRLFADVVTLQDGRQISGLVESGNIQELHVKVGDRSQTIDIHDVQAIQFGISLPAAPPPAKAADLAGTVTRGIGVETASRTMDSLDGARIAPANANALPPVDAVKSQAKVALTGAMAGAGAAAGAEAAAIRAGAGALTIAGEFTGKGPKNASEPPFTNSLTPPAFIDSKRGGQ